MKTAHLKELYTVNDSIYIPFLKQSHREGEHTVGCQRSGNDYKGAAREPGVRHRYLDSVVVTWNYT